MKRANECWRGPCSVIQGERQRSPEDMSIAGVSPISIIRDGKNRNAKAWRRERVWNVPRREACLVWPEQFGVERS